jgi:RNAse (barnase) inhibitor barstar
MRKSNAVKIIHIDCEKIRDWASFHKVFADELGFPDYYGRNMDAWIDCMTYLDEPESGMTRVSVEPGEVLTLILDNVKSLKNQLPEIYDALVECSGFVNWRRVDHNEAPILALAFYS